MRVEVISIPVSDQERALSFYCDQLGFVVLFDTPFEEGKRWIQLAPESGAETSITLVNWFDRMAPGSIQGLVIGSDDIESAHARLTKSGVELSPIEERPWGRFTHLKDPDGNGLSLHQGGPNGE